MAQFKLTYFDFDGGRAEPARLALKLVVFDLRISESRFPTGTSTETSFAIVSYRSLK